MSSKFDPVEAAKIVRDRPAKAAPAPKEADKAEAPLAPPQAAPPPPPGTGLSPVPAKPATLPPPVPASVAQAAKRAARFRVKVGRNISWCGSITHLAAGAVVDASGYGGEPGIRKLVEQGVELEPID